jgi:colicin import membrane protein
MSYDQFQTESAGRLSSFHETGTMREAAERWKQLAEENPEMAEAAQKELEWLEQLAAEQAADRELNRDRDLDRLIDGKSEEDRDWERMIDKEVGVDAERALRGLLREEEERQRQEQQPEREKNEGDFLSELVGPDRQHQERPDTFERDWQSKQFEESQDDRDDEEKRERERDRGDDFGR